MGEVYAFIAVGTAIIFLAYCHRYGYFDTWPEHFADTKAAVRRLLKLPLPLPTQAETRQAIVLMQAVHSHIDDIFAGKLGPHKVGPAQAPYFQIKILEQAARNLKAARRLDPDAVYETVEENQKYRYTQDILAARLLLLESHSHEALGRNEFLGEFDVSLYRWKKKREQAHFANALNAVNRANNYLPNNEGILCQQATCLFLLGDKGRARRMMKQAQALYPDSIDVVKKMQELR